MNARVLTLGLIATAACVDAPEPAVDYGSFEDVRRIVTGLDDVAGEYPSTVARGAVIDPVRMRVLERVMHDAQVFALHLTDAERAPLAALARAIDDRAPAPAVVMAARWLRRATLARRHLVFAPAAPPSRARAEQQWAMMCTGCHGDGGAGDGAQGLYLQPEPKNFQDPEFIATLAPSRAYSRITDGMAGTAMPSWGIPSNAERWGLAALVFSFRYDAADIARGRALARLDGVTGSWTALADRADAEIVAGLERRGWPTSAAEDILAYVRAEVAFAPVTGRLADVRAALADGLGAYQERRFDEGARHLARARRLIWPRRDVVAAADRTLAARLDEQLGRLVTTAAHGAMAEIVTHEMVRTQALLDRAEQPLTSPDVAGAITLALERGGLAALALGLLLARRRRSRLRSGSALAGALLGLGVGALLPMTAAALPIVALGAVGGLLAALAATRLGPRADARAWPVALAGLAFGPGLATAAIARALATSSAGAGVATGLTATLLLAGVALVTCFAGRRLRRPAWRHLTAGVLAAAAAATVGQAAWRWWTLSGSSDELRAVPGVEVLGLHPASPALVAVGVAAVLTLGLATRAVRSDPPAPAAPPAPDRRG